MIKIAPKISQVYLVEVQICPLDTDVEWHVGTMYQADERTPCPPAALTPSVTEVNRVVNLLRVVSQSTYFCPVAFAFLTYQMDYPRI